MARPTSAATSAGPGGEKVGLLPLKWRHGSLKESVKKIQINEEDGG